LSACSENLMLIKGKRCAAPYLEHLDRDEEGGEE
jgi:hypothetical protein